jgi:hypothetical protein
MIILNALDSPAVIVVIDSLSQLTGIVPTLILVLCAFQRDIDTRRQTTLSTWRTNAENSGGAARQRRLPTQRLHGQIELDSITLNPADDANVHFRPKLSLTESSSTALEDGKAALSY